MSPLRITPTNIGAIISAMEADLRKLIILHLEGQEEIHRLLGEELWEKCTKRQLHEQGFTNDKLQDLLLYADFADLYHILNSKRNLLPDQLARHLRIITPYLDQLVPIRNRIAHNRPLYYDDCSIVDQLVQAHLREHSDIWRTLEGVLVLRSEEQNTKDIKAFHNLPMPDYEETGYIGRKKQVEDLKRLCLQSPYPVITVIGDGGVGKSALALKAAYDIIGSQECPFDAIVWTTSKTTQLTP